METIATIGLDLAKNVFQVHCVDSVGNVVIRRQLRRGEVLKFFTRVPGVPDRHGGMWHRSSLGSRTVKAWP